MEILKSFRKNRKEKSVLCLKRVSIRFDKRCYRFSTTTNVLTPYWLTLTLNHKRVSFPIVFGKHQKHLIEQALGGNGLSLLLRLLSIMENGTHIST